MRGIRQRCESSREENARQDKRPLLTSQEWPSIENGTREGISLLRWHEWLGKTNEEPWGWLGSLDIFPLRRPAMKSTEELRGIKGEEDLPRRIGGEVEVNLRIPDGPKVAKLPKPEKHGW